MILGCSVRICRPVGLLCIRASMLDSAAVPVVSPSAATRSARRGLQRKARRRKGIKAEEALCGVQTDAAALALGLHMIQPRSHALKAGANC